MRHRGNSGKALGLAVLLPFVLPLLADAAQAGPIEDLAGSWATAAGGDPVMQVSGTADGFTVAWTPEGGTTTTVQFAPAGRPGVYGGTAKEGWSIMGSMFGGNAPVNPLEGGTLYWARTADGGVYLYRMQIDDHGAFTIDRYRLGIADGALSVAGDRRTADGDTALPDRQLVRVGS
jgi:hypothetical protein